VFIDFVLLTKEKAMLQSVVDRLIEREIIERK
jgi:hypothetical protein